MARIALALFVSVLVAHAGEPIDIPTSALTFRKGVVFTEGLRGMGDAFPYVSARLPGDARGVDLSPKTLGRFVTGVASDKAAIEAVRLFAGGTLVRDGAKAKLLIEEAGKLQKKIRLLPIKIHKHRPASYAPVAAPDKKTGGWNVSLVVFEMDNVLRLVHVRAAVSPKGAIKIERKSIIDGPMTVWQAAAIAGGEQSDIELSAAQERRMRSEAVLARRRFAQVLRPKRDLDNAWAIARLRLSYLEIVDLWGEQSEIVTSGLRVVSYDLKGDNAVLFDATASRRPVYRMRHIRHVKRAPPLSREWKILHRLSAER